MMTSLMKMISLIVIIITTSFAMLSPSPVFSAVMQDYCSIPPYIGASSGAPPNIMLVYEKGATALKRAYSPTYTPKPQIYYGFFDTESNYSFTADVNGYFPYFEKSACTPSAMDLDCISGNILNWSLMSSLDLSRKALVGFGWPEPGVGKSAGEVFTYSGPFLNLPDTTPRTIGQWSGDVGTKISVTRNIDSSAYTYSFCLSKTTGSNATGLKVIVRSGISPIDSCSDIVCTGANDISTGLCLGDGSVTMKFADGERRNGVLQKFIDKDRDLIYDDDAPMIGIRRYTSATDKNLDIFCDDATPPAGCSSNCSSDDIAPLFGDLLTTVSKAPPAETGLAPVADMTVEITKYFAEDSSADHIDNDDYTQTPYSWCDDPASRCRDNYIVFITTGAESGTEVFFPLLDECGPDVLGTDAYFAQNVCHAYNADLSSTVTGPQYVETHVVHTSFYGSEDCTQDSDCPGGLWSPQWNMCIAGSCDATDALQYAVDQGAGNYFKVDDPSKFEEAIEELLLSLLDKASSGTAASVVAGGEGQGANLIQSIYYPERKFGNTDIQWIGVIQNLWYDLNPRILASTIREDTDNNRKLHVAYDHILNFRFDETEEQTMVERWNDIDGDGVPESLVADLYLEDFLKKSTNLWEAGVNLWKRDITADPRNLKTHIGNSTTLIDFDPSDAGIVSQMQPELLAADTVEAKDIMDYVHGKDIAGYRNRTVSYDANNNGTIDADETHVWKLFDNVNSTPKVVSALPLNNYDEVYYDNTYTEFTETNYYKNRFVVVAGGNDGILHFFKLGTLTLLNNGKEKARLDGSDLGKEIYGFIPYGALPYLKYLGDPTYCHVYGVDAAPYVFDASINGAAGDKRDVNSWKTVVIGSMRLGGACRNPGSGCTDCVESPEANKGMTSYFALDVTDINPDNWTLLWEFSHPDLGFTTTGPAIVRINSDVDVDGNPERDTNGEWFVVMASGPTGPIDKAQRQFMARSDQKLKIFVLDLRTGSLKTTIQDLGHQGTLSYAFGGNLVESTVDPDLDYSDDALYFGYTYSDTGTGNTFNKGGIIRLITKEDTDPSNWVASRLVHGIGPVTASVSRLENTSTNNLWTFFGEGRYYYVMDLGATVDDGDTQRRVFGVKDPCFSGGAFNTACTDTLPLGANITDVTTIQDVPDSQEGWFINLDPVDTSANRMAERVITNPIASDLGAVFFVTFKPSNGICGFPGGDTYLWSLAAGTGGSLGTLKAKALVQVSTGSIEQQDLPAALSEKENRRTTAMAGVPPSGAGLSLVLPPRPVREILHIRER
jgi:type IV pilus assembly protein PilY1